MKTSKSLVVCLLLGVAGMGNAWADRGHHSGHHSRFSVVVGPYWGPAYYQPFPYYYPPYYPPVVIERPAPVYIEQAQVPAPQAPAAAAPINYWYYCAATNGYYPYVRECRGGWQKVSPVPPGQH